MKQFLTVILILALFTAFAVPAFAADDEDICIVYNETELAAALTGSGEIHIKGDITLTANTSISSKLKVYVEENCTLTVPDGVTLTVYGYLMFQSSARLILNGTLNNRFYVSLGFYQLTLNGALNTAAAAAYTELYAYAGSAETLIKCLNDGVPDIYLISDAILTEELLIPAGCTINVYNNYTLTINTTVISEGEILLSKGAKLIFAENALFWNCGDIWISTGAKGLSLQNSGRYVSIGSIVLEPTASGNAASPADFLSGFETYTVKVNSVDTGKRTIFYLQGEQGVYISDVNLNGECDLTDVSMMFRFWNGKFSLFVPTLVLDRTGDGCFDLRDIAALYSAIAK